MTWQALGSPRRKICEIAISRIFPKDAPQGAIVGSYEASLGNRRCDGLTKRATLPRFITVPAVVVSHHGDLIAVIRCGAGVPQTCPTLFVMLRPLGGQ